MSIASILKKELKAGYYVVFYDDMQYANTESEALRIVDTLDKMGCDAVVYSYRDGVFRKCIVVDMETLILKNRNT